MRGGVRAFKSGRGSGGRSPCGSKPTLHPDSARGPPSWTYNRLRMRLAACLLLAFLAPVSRAGAEALRLALPEGLPPAFRVDVPWRGGLVTLDLEARSVRAPDFRLRAWAEGVTTTVEPPPPSTYRGAIEGRPGSVVAGSLTPVGLHAIVRLAEGDSWTLRPLGHGLHALVEGSDWPAGAACGVTAEAGGPAPPAVALPEAHALRDPARVPGLPGERPSPSWCGPSGMKLAEIAFDVDQVYYRNLGSDLAAVTANVEAHLAAVDAFYARDTLITYRLTDLIVRTTDFYLPDATTGSLLDLFRNEWNANQTGVQRDIAHLMTGQPAPGLAGLAYVAVTCDRAWCYGWSVDSSGVLGHELGHNWSAGHCHDTSPCNAMCGACLFHGPNTKDIIMSFRDSRTCLDDVPAYSSPVPPYAHPDLVDLTRDLGLARAPVPVDVLANDHDANCDDLSIAAFDAVTPRGGRVELDAGGGPGGRDQLLYTPPCMVFGGTDALAYTVEDATASASSTRATLDVLDPGLVGYWPLDDGAGAVAADATGWRRDGTVNGAAAWGSGAVGGALELNGVDQYVGVPGPNLDGREVTITAWARRDGVMSSFTALVASRGGGTTAGLHVGLGPDLRYTWADDPGTYSWSSGLNLPDGRWTFVALVVRPADATIYMDDGTWRSATHAFAHVRQRFPAEISLGRDPAGGGRYLRGALDDVRLFDVALTEAELRAIRDGAGRAEAPVPPDGGSTSDPDVVLSWTPAAAASAHEVYFGTDLQAVRDAAPGSPAFAGTTASPAFDPAGLLAEGVTYAWRVDEITPGGTVPGTPWLFTFRGRTPRLLAYWKLDEGAGSVAADATGGGRDGAVEARAAWTAGPRGGALAVGPSGIARLPPLDHAGSEMTLTAWVRTSGAPAPWAGIVFSRAAGTTSGLNFRDTNELGYHWNGAYETWSWSSGLVVPADTWTFVALAVEPGRATLMMDDGGGLRTAVNAVGHAAQDFAGETLLGRDAWGAARTLAGELDEVRVFDRALTPLEVEAVRDLAGRASNPVPADGVLLASAPSELAWVPGAGATLHEVYLGDDLAAVRAAGPGSPEHRASIPGARWTPDVALAGGRTWYWRVDAVAEGVPVAGETWRFAVAEGVGGTLRVRKAPGLEPRLEWTPAASSLGHDVLRCVPPAGGSCVPAGVASLPATAGTWDDPGAAADRLVWYSVSATPCLP